MADSANELTVAPEVSQGLWADIKESVRVSHRSYTTGPIGRAILLLAIPMVLEMIMESVFAVVDIFWVSHLGTDAAATVGLTESLMTLVYTLAIGAPLAPKLLAAMGGSPWVIEHGSSFTRVMLAGNISVVMLFMINAIFRGSGDPAIATNIGRGTGALFAISKLIREGGRFSIERRHLRIEPAIIGRMIRLSSTGTFQVFIGMASWIGLVRIISSFGSNAVAGYTF